MSLGPPLDDARYTVRTDGTIQHGYDRALVALEIGHVLALDSAAIEAILDGGPRDLERGLDDASATEFVRKVERAGLRVWRELDVAPPTLEWLGDPSLTLPLELPAKVVRASFPPPAYESRERPEPDPTAVARDDAARLARSRSSRPAPRARPRDEPEFADPARVLAFDGRIGRVRYLVRGALIPTLLLGAAFPVALFADRAFLVCLLVGAAVGSVVSLSATVARLHDLNLSGAYALFPMLTACVVQPALYCGLGFSPTFTGIVSIGASALSLLLGVALLFAPGDTEANHYGPRAVADTSLYRIVALLLVLAVVVEGLVVYRVVERTLPELEQRLRSQQAARFGAAP